MIDNKNNEQDLNKPIENSPSSAAPLSQPSLSTEGVSNTEENTPERLSVEEKRWEILQFLMKNPYSTTYAVGKGVNIAYSQIHEVMRQLVFCRLVLSKRKEAENGEIYDHYYIPSEMKFCNKCSKYRGMWKFTDKYICCVCGRDVPKEEKNG